MRNLYRPQTALGDANRSFLALYPYPLGIWTPLWKALV